MTNDEVVAYFEVWNPSLENLTSYQGNSVLSDASVHASEFVRDRGEKGRKLSASVRERARALRNLGLSIEVIAARLNLPKNRVWAIGRSGSDTASHSESTPRERSRPAARRVLRP